MNASLWLANLMAWWLQAALLLAVGLALPAFLRLGSPGARLGYWRGLLAATLTLPLIQIPPSPLRFADELDVAGGLLPSLGASVWTDGVRGSWAEIILLALALGAVTRLAWLALGWHALRRWLREAASAPSCPAIEKSARLTGTSALFLLSSHVTGPATLGLRAPVVLLPSDFSLLAPQARLGIACHELLHVRRRDWLAMVCEEVLTALLWFHPGLWLLMDRIHLAREQVIDAEVVRLTGARRAYLEALWSIASRRPAACASGLRFLRTSHLLQRVAQLGKEIPMPRARLILRLASLAAVVAATAVVGMFRFPMAGGTAAALPAPASEGEPLEVSGGVQPPRRLAGEAPVYPASAREQKLEGVTVLKCIINAEGKVSDLAVTSSSGHADLDQAAADAVATWTFEPATLDGEAVAVYYTLTINFALDDDPPAEGGGGAPRRRA
jgi:TonB family protein